MVSVILRKNLPLIYPPEIPYEDVISLRWRSIRWPDASALLTLCYLQHWPCSFISFSTTTWTLQISSNVILFRKHLIFNNKLEKTSDTISRCMIHLRIHFTLSSLSLKNIRILEYKEARNKAMYQCQIRLKFNEIILEK